MPTQHLPSPFAINPGGTARARVVYLTDSFFAHSLPIFAAFEIVYEYRIYRTQRLPAALSKNSARRHQDVNERNFFLISFSLFDLKHTIKYIERSI